MKTSEKTYGIKNNKLEKLRALFFNAGLFISLSLTFLAFEYTAEKVTHKPVDVSDLEDEGWNPVNFIYETKKEVKKDIPKQKKKETNTFNIKKVENNEPETIETASNVENLDSLLDLFNEEPEQTENIKIMVPLEWAQEMPHFKDCSKYLTEEERRNCTDDKISEILDRSLKVPLDVKKLGGTFTAYARILIDDKGQIKNVEVLRSPTKSFTMAVKKALREIPEMEPGKQNGRNVSVYFVKPIKLILK